MEKEWRDATHLSSPRIRHGSSETRGCLAHFFWVDGVFVNTLPFFAINSHISSSWIVDFCVFLWWFVWISRRNSTAKATSVGKHGLNSINHGCIESCDTMQYTMPQCEAKCIISVDWSWMILTHLDPCGPRYDDCPSSGSSKRGSQLGRRWTKIFSDSVSQAFPGPICYATQVFWCLICFCFEDGPLSI